VDRNREEATKKRGKGPRIPGKNTPANKAGESSSAGSKRPRISAVSAVERAQRVRRRKAGELDRPAAPGDAQDSDDSDIDDDGGAAARAQRSARSRRRVGSTPASALAVSADIPAWKVRAERLQAQEAELRRKTMAVGKVSAAVAAGDVADSSDADDLAVELDDDDGDDIGGQEDDGAILSQLYSKKRRPAASMAAGGSKNKIKDKNALARAVSPGGTALDWSLHSSGYVRLKMVQEDGTETDILAHPREAMHSIRSKYADKLHVSVACI